MRFSAKALMHLPLLQIKGLLGRTWERYSW